jgi:hypothetical protein
VNGASPCVDELDEPVGGVEGELHGRRLTNIRSYLKQPGETALPSDKVSLGYVFPRRPEFQQGTARCALSQGTKRRVFPQRPELQSGNHAVRALLK